MFALLLALSLTFGVLQVLDALDVQDNTNFSSSLFISYNTKNLTFNRSNPSYTKFVPAAGVGSKCAREHRR